MGHYASQRPSGTGKDGGKKGGGKSGKSGGKQQFGKSGGNFGSKGPQQYPQYGKGHNREKAQREKEMGQRMGVGIVVGHTSAMGAHRATVLKESLARSDPW